MILVITMFETDRFGKRKEVVSHGVDEITGLNVCLPCEHPTDLGAWYCEDRHEWVLPSPERPLQAPAPRPLQAPAPRPLETSMEILGVAVDQLIETLQSLK